MFEHAEKGFEFKKRECFFILNSSKGFFSKFKLSTETVATSLNTASIPKRFLEPVFLHISQCSRSEKWRFNGN